MQLGPWFDLHLLMEASNVPLHCGSPSKAISWVNSKASGSSKAGMASNAHQLMTQLNNNALRNTIHTTFNETHACPEGMNEFASSRSRKSTCSLRPMHEPRFSAFVPHATSTPSISGHSSWWFFASSLTHVVFNRNSPFRNDNPRTISLTCWARSWGMSGFSFVLIGTPFFCVVFAL